MFLFVSLLFFYCLVNFVIFFIFQSRLHSYRNNTFICMHPYSSNWAGHFVLQITGRSNNKHCTLRIVPEQNLWRVEPICGRIWVSIFWHTRTWKCDRLCFGSVEKTRTWKCTRRSCQNSPLGQVKMFNSKTFWFEPFFPFHL